VKRAGIWFLSALAIILLIALLLNDSRPPPIAQGVITELDSPRFETASKKLTEALQSKFPIGSREEILKSSLLGQGFRSVEPPPSNCIPPGQHVPIGVIFYQCLTPAQEEQRKRTLVYKWGGGICTEFVYVTWSSDELGTLTHVGGRYYGACL